MKFNKILGIFLGFILISSFLPTVFSETSDFFSGSVKLSSSTSVNDVNENNILNIEPIGDYLTKNSTNWNPSVPDSIKQYKEYNFNPILLQKQIEQQQSILITLDNSTYSMKLEPNILRAPDAWTRVTLENGTTINIEPLDVKTYKGYAEGLEKNSSIRLTIYDDWLAGFVNTGNDTYQIEKMQDIAGNYLSKYLIYKETDVKLVPFYDAKNSTSSALTMDIISSSISQFVFPSFFTSASAASTYNTKIILDCDKEFDELDTVAWFTRQLATLNDITGLYDDLDIGFTVVGQSCDISNTDLDGTSTADLLDDLEDRWVDVQTQRHVVHLYTGKQLTDNLLGLAKTLGIDNPRTRGYSLVQHAAEGLYLAFDGDKQRLMAHEIGHNFGAAHDAHELCTDDIGPCSVVHNTIMCTYDPDKFGTDEFCDNAFTKFEFSEGSLGVDHDNAKIIVDNAALYLIDQYPIDCLNRPSAGTWTVSHDCTLKNDYSAPTDAIIQSDSLLIIPDGTTLFLDFSSDHLMIKSGSSVLIKSGGMITSPP